MEDLRLSMEETRHGHGSGSEPPYIPGPGEDNDLREISDILQMQIHMRSSVENRQLQAMLRLISKPDLEWR